MNHAQPNVDRRHLKGVAGLGVSMPIPFLKALIISIREGNYIGAFYFTIRAIHFLFLVLWHELLWPHYCRNCGTPTKLYFMRSPANVLGEGSDDELYDWVICQNENCLVAEQLGGNDV